MRKIFIVIALFTAGLVTSCDTYEERRADRSEENLEEVEIQEEGEDTEGKAESTDDELQNDSK